MKQTIDYPLEVVEAREWQFFVRSTTNRRKFPYEVVLRKDGTYWCSCRSFKFNGQECKHIECVKMVSEISSKTNVA
jgi:hypothetical protein